MSSVLLAISRTTTPPFGPWVGGDGWTALQEILPCRCDQDAGHCTRAYVRRDRFRGKQDGAAAGVRFAGKASYRSCSFDAARPRNRGKMGTGAEIRVGWPCEEARDWAVRLHRAYRGVLRGRRGLLKRELADDEGDKNSDHYDGRRMRVCATATDGLPYCTLVLGSLVGSLEVGHV